MWEGGQSRKRLVSLVVLELLVATIIARRTIVVLGALRAMTAAVIPSPAVARLPVLTAIGVAECPSTVPLDPMAAASLVPVI
jgi:hypothetical protein